MQQVAVCPPPPSRPVPFYLLNETARAVGRNGQGGIRLRVPKSEAQHAAIILTDHRHPKIYTIAGFLAGIVGVSRVCVISLGPHAGVIFSSS
jgi:hypothetical protein